MFWLLSRWHSLSYRRKALFRALLPPSGMRASLRQRGREFFVRESAGLARPCDRACISRKRRDELYLRGSKPVIHKTYEIVCRLPADAALEQIKVLLTKECVKYTAADLSVISTQMPMVFFGFDPRAFTHANWVRINPFAYVSGVEVRCESVDNGLTKVIVRVDRVQAFVWLGICVACSSAAAISLPALGGAIFLIVFNCAAWFYFVSFLGGYLIKKEIGDHLKDGTHQCRRDVKAP